MLINDHDQYITPSQYQVVGMCGNTRKLYHVGYRDGEPIFFVSDSPDNIVPSFAITIHHLLTFNPIGWELDEDKINSLYMQRKKFLNETPKSE